MYMDVLTTKEPEKWRKYCGDRMVFALPEYAALKERHLGIRASLFVVSDGSGAAVHPMFRKATIQVAGEPELWDSTTPEYTGPYLVGNPRDLPRLSEAFAHALREHLTQEHIVTQFGHLHPWECRFEFLSSEDIRVNRDIVFVDLTRSPEDVWENSFSHACRKNIRKSEREGVRVFRGCTSSDTAEFARIYRMTMERNNALSSYYLPDSHFEWFREAMPQNAIFLLAEYKGAPVAATLYLHDSSYMFSYLGGADETYQHVRPTNAVVYGAVQLGKALGLRALVLGGGYRPDDGIFRFKSTFSPSTVSFSTYEHVHMPDQYEQLCRLAGVSADERLSGCFPPYRQTRPGEAGGEVRIQDGTG
jgi:hypothetical protein